MPFGLSTSSAYFQKYVNAVFAFNNEKYRVDMDDLIIPPYREGLLRLKEALQVANSYRLEIN